MNQYDQLLMQWAKENHLNAEDFGIPIAQYVSPDDSTEELPHILNDYSEEGVATPLPREIIAYKLSLWSGQNVPPTHPLVVHNNKYRDAMIDLDFGPPENQADRITAKQLGLLIHQLAPDKIDLEHFNAYLEDDTTVGQGESVYVTNINGQIYRFAIDQNEVAHFLGENGMRSFTLDGNPAPPGGPGIQAILLQSPHRAVEPGQLASIVGNRLADNIIGDDGLGLLDFPTEYD